MNRLQRRRKQAASRLVFVFKHFGAWDIVVDSEGPYGWRSLKLTKRQAINLAYQISVAKVHKLTVSTLMS
jgi:hypothetical protein